VTEKKLFNELEAIKMAISIEKRGERFYRKAAQKIQDNPDIVDTLLYLAKEEKEHAETFQQIYNDFMEKKHDFDDTYLYEPEVEAYLDAMVSTTVFPADEAGDDILEKIQTNDDALRLGIQAEKDSILFYTEMIIYSKLPEAKAAFRRLLQEEKKHLVDLKSRLDKKR